MVLCSVSEEKESGGRARTSQTSHGLHSWTSSGFLLSESSGKAGSHDRRCMHLPDQDGAAELLLLPWESQAASCRAPRNSHIFICVQLRGNFPFHLLPLRGNSSSA